MESKENHQLKNDNFKGHCYIITYQSNAVINEATHNEVKFKIWENLSKDFTVLSCHTYFHSQLIIEIQTPTSSKTHNDIVAKVNSMFPKFNPELMFSVVLAGRSTDGTTYIYAEGNKAMDDKFQIEIKKPKAAPKTT